MKLSSQLNNVERMLKNNTSKARYIENVMGGSTDCVSGRWHLKEEYAVDRVEKFTPPEGMEEVPYTFSVQARVPMTKREYENEVDKVDENTEKAKGKYLTYVGSDFMDKEDTQDYFSSMGAEVGKDGEGEVVSISAEFQNGVSINLFRAKDVAKPKGEKLWENII